MTTDGGLIAVDGLQKRPGEGRRRGEERLVVGVGLDQLRRVEPARLTGMEASRRQRNVTSAADVGAWDFEAGESAEGERPEDQGERLLNIRAVFRRGNACWGSVALVRNEGEAGRHEMTAKLFDEHYLPSLDSSRVRELTPSSN